MNEKVSLIPIGGIGDVTKNMYLYEYKDEILIVDCGIGFADETMPGVDLLIPDITYLKQTKKKIVGMMLTHGHEDHIGALPFLLPQLPNFPIYGSKLTAALANEKVKEFNIGRQIQTAEFCREIQIGSFKITPVRVTHSILDAANLLIRTRAGNFYHGSDYKFDFTPLDGHNTDFGEIAKFGNEGILCALIDALGSEKEGFSKSEQHISESFEEQFRNTKGRLYISTYSSHISRMNQAIDLAKKYNRKVVLMGRSFLKVRDVARKLGYMDLPQGMEIKPNQVKSFPPNQVLILVAGSQAQADSALMRIASGNDRDLSIQKGDTIVFSSDPIPGNEANVNSLVDLLTRNQATVLHSGSADYFHVSGHGSQGDIKLMISLTKPRYLVPIGGQYHHMVSFRKIAVDMQYQEGQVILLDDGREVIFSQEKYELGRKIPSKSVLVDQITGEEMDNYVIRDRLKVSQEGIVIVMVEVNTEDGQIVEAPDIITKGFVYSDKKSLTGRLQKALQQSFQNRKGKVSNWGLYKKIIEEKTEEILYKEGREPLVVPVIIES